MDTTPTRRPSNPLEYAIFRTELTLNHIKQAYYDDIVPEPTTASNKEQYICHLAESIQDDMRIIRKEVMHK